MFKFIQILLLFFVCTSPVYAVTVTTSGEAAIFNGDVPSSRAMAVSRAKWAAIEKVSGVRVKVDTIVNNAVIADEAVKSELSATVKSFRILSEKQVGNRYLVTVESDVEPVKARETLNKLSSDTSVFVFIIDVLPNNIRQLDRSFSASVISGLASKGFSVSDVHHSDERSMLAAEKALATDNYNVLKNIFMKTVSSYLLIGNLKVLPKDADIGYSHINFKIVDGVLDWKLIGTKNGRKVVITSGTLRGRGQGMTLTAAADNLYRNMSKNHAFKIVSDIEQKTVNENAKTIGILLKGESDIRYTHELREYLKNVPFMLDVKETGLGSLLVNYPDKTYYLASFLTKNHLYHVVRLEENSIILERR